MPYHRPQLPLVATPAMDQWTHLALPPNQGISSLDRLRMPQLTSLDINDNPLSSLPWTDMTSLENLWLFNLPLAEALVWQLPALTSFAASEMPQLQYVDAHDLIQLTHLDVVYAPQLSDVAIHGCSQLTWLSMHNCALGESMVDQILADLVANGASNGYLNLRFGSNQPPSQDGLASRAVLIDRGWTVLTQ